jgi:SAM-dependent methyltransferase
MLLASAKRKRNERSGIHAWHPYYAGYSEDFLLSAIEYLNLSSNSVVLDPWAGSGTTQFVCAKKEIKALGVEVNPIMAAFANAKTGFVLQERLRIEKFLKELELNATDQSYNSLDLDGNDPLLEWMSESLCLEMRRIMNKILSFKSKKDEIFIHKYPSCISKNMKIKISDPITEFLKAGLFITGRQLAKYSGGSNPTWTRATKSLVEYKFSDVRNAYIKQCYQMLSDVSGAGIKNNTFNISLVANSRNLPFNDNYFDAVITSPPYLTRIDYAISTKPELLLMGNNDFLRKIREETMGAPVIVDRDIEKRNSWGVLCNALLDSVESHSSKAAKSYYLPNIVQYFRDADESLSEIIRVVKPGCRALIVVQSSYFKEHEIALGEMYVEMAIEKNCKAKIISRDIVKGHMAHVNTKSSGYKENKIYYEDVVEVIM